MGRADDECRRLLLLSAQVRPYGSKTKGVEPSQREDAADEHGNRDEGDALGDAAGNAVEHEQLPSGGLPEKHDRGQRDAGCDGIDGRVIARRNEPGETRAESPVGRYEAAGHQTRH